MKEVTIENVRERIAELNCLSGDGVLSLRGEFELACLRKLVASIQQEPKNKAAMATLESKGYTWNGGQLWKPPLGTAPAYITDEPTTDNTAQQFEALAASQHGSCSNCGGTGAGTQHAGGECPQCLGSGGAPQQSTLSQAITDVIAERQRQVSGEGWQLGHDDQYVQNDLIKAAVSYCMASFGNNSMLINKLWPWNKEWWKPTTPRRNLVKAGALILAEIERLDRMTTSAGSGKQ